MSTPLRPHESDARKLNAAEFQDSIKRQIEAIRFDLGERMVAYLAKHEEIVYDVKLARRQREWLGKVVDSFGVRLKRIETEIGLHPFKIDPEHPGPGEWQHRAFKPPAADEKAPLLDAWRVECNAAAAKLQKDLPALVGIPELARYWGVSYTAVRYIITRGQLAVIRQGNKLKIPLEAIGVYVARYGVPRPKKLFYGSSSVVEHKP